MINSIKKIKSKKTKKENHISISKTHKNSNSNSNNNYNNKPELNLTNFNELYENIISNCKDSGNTYIEFILNYYLLLKNERNIFEIKCMEVDYKILQKLFIDKYNLFYIVEYDKKRPFQYRLIFYNPKTFNIDTLDKTFGKKFAEQLGSFYICARNDIKGIFNKNGRVTINVTPCESIKCKTSKFNKYFEITLYAQMCKYSDITKEINLKKIMKIFKKIKKIITDLDKRLCVNMNIDFTLK